VSDRDEDDDTEDDELAADADAPGAVEDRRAEAALLYPWLPPGIDLGLDAHLGPDGKPRTIERRFEVAVDHAGWRLDHYLKQQIPRLSRTRLQAIIGGQLARADGRPVKPAQTVAAGDVYVIRRPARAEPPSPRTIEILLDEPEFVVIDKPAGLPVHASAKFYYNTLTTVLRERFGDPAPQICHRLDRETSGALVCARTREAAAVIKGAFASKKVRKVYLAIVHGQPPWDTTQELDTPLAVAGPDDDTQLPGVRMVARPLARGGLPSATHVRVLERAGEYALVHCAPITGRQHQIRAHLALAGFPIVGDKLYAHGDALFRRFCDEGLTPELAARFELPRQALHAHEVRFPHPSKPSEVQAISPLARELRTFLDRAAGRS
jgi:23S rRNA pseudouridine1911/1915/1917 synthase